MKKLSLSLLTLLILLNSYNLLSRKNEVSASLDTWSCIDTSADFLYQMVKIKRNDSHYTLPTVHPPQPWELVTDIPSTLFHTGNSLWNLRTLELATKYSNETELWIRDEQHLIRYKTASNTFSTVSPFPIDQDSNPHNDVYVRDLFEIADGSILGINYPKNHNTVWEEELPLFSIYNEGDNRFQIYEMGLRYPASDIRFDWDGMIPRDGIIITTNKDFIWIYQQQDGLFRYDPLTTNLFHYDISFDGIVQSMTLSSEGYLLFRLENKEGWELLPGELIEYYPHSQTFKEINVPYFRWPDYGTILYTDSGDLWLGIHGYLSKNGSWVLKSPSRNTYTDLGQSSSSFNWSHPKLMLQSSNGYLWYTNEKGDYLGVNGTAWYDPISDTGCWFTTEAGYIVEDNHKTLWMMADKKIYKYVLPNNLALSP